MPMTDGGNSFDLGCLVSRAAAARIKNSCSDFGKNPSYALTDRILINLGYQTDDKGRMLPPRSPTNGGYTTGKREVLYRR